jgi:hypothetical protein
MIDVASAVLGVNGTQLTVTFNLRGPVSNLTNSELAQWNVTLVLQNATAGVNTYQAVVNLNGSQLTGQIQDMDTLVVQDCPISYSNNLYGKNVLTIQPVLDELPATTTIQWRVVTTYEQFSGGELVTSATDVAPDQGLQQTVLTK